MQETEQASLNARLAWRNYSDGSMITRNQELLLEVLHIDPAKPAQSEFAHFSPSDWDAFISAAIRHRLSCQIIEYLSSNPSIRDLVPDDGRARLDRKVRSQLQHNFSQYQRTRTILQACDQARIPVILFKGLWLVDYVYRDPKARGSGDIDLLITPDKMSAFTRVVRDIGCMVPDGVTSLQALAPASNEYPLRYRNSETVIDIHWSVTHPMREAPIDEQRIWSRAESTTIAGVTCLSFRLEDHLLYLCFHAALHHNFAYVGPRAILDISKLVENPPRPIDWYDFVVRARELSWSRGVWLTLHLVHRLIGVAPPPFVLDELRPVDTPNSDFHSQVLDAIFFDQSHRKRLSSNAAHLVDASWYDKFKILSDRLFPSPAEIATQYGVAVGSPAFSKLYAKRLLSLTRRHVPALFQIFVRDPSRVAEKDRVSAIDSWLRGRR